MHCLSMPRANPSRFPIKCLYYLYSGDFIAWCASRHVLQLLHGQVAAAAPARHVASAGAVAATMLIAARNMSAVALTWRMYREAATAVGSTSAAAAASAPAASPPWLPQAAAAAPVCALGAVLPPALAQATHSRALTAASTPQRPRSASFSPHSFVNLACLAGQGAAAPKTDSTPPNDATRLAEAILAYVADLSAPHPQAAGTSWPPLCRGEATWLALVLACTLEAAVADAWACAEAYACAASAAQAIISEHAVLGGLLWGAAAGCKRQQQSSPPVGAPAVQVAAAEALAKGSSHVFVQRACAESALSHVGVVALFEATHGPAHVLKAWRCSAEQHGNLSLAALRPATVHSSTQGALAALALLAAGPKPPLLPVVTVPAVACPGCPGTPHVGSSTLRAACGAWLADMARPLHVRLQAKAVWMQPLDESADVPVVHSPSKKGPPGPPSGASRPPPSPSSSSTRQAAIPVAVQGCGVTGRALDDVSLQFRTAALTSALSGGGSSTSTPPKGSTSPTDSGPISRPKPPKAKASTSAAAVSASPPAPEDTAATAAAGVSDEALQCTAQACTARLLLSMQEGGQIYKPTNVTGRMATPPSTPHHTSGPGMACATLPALGSALVLVGVAGREASHSHTGLARGGAAGGGHDTPPSHSAITLREHETNPTHVLSQGTQAWYLHLFQSALQAARTPQGSAPSVTAVQHQEAVAALQAAPGSKKSPLTIASSCVEGTRGMGPYLSEAKARAVSAAGKGSSGLLGRLAGKAVPVGASEPPRRSGGDVSSVDMNAAAAAALAAIEAASNARRAHSVARALMHCERHRRTCAATHALLCSDPSCGAQGANSCALTQPWLADTHVTLGAVPGAVPGYTSPLALQCGAGLQVPGTAAAETQQALQWGLQAPQPLCLRAALLGELPPSEYAWVQRELTAHVPELERLLGEALAGHTDEDVPLVLSHLSGSAGGQDGCVDVATGLDSSHGQPGTQLMRHALALLMACARVAVRTPDTTVQRMKETAVALQRSGMLALLPASDVQMDVPRAADDALAHVGCLMALASLGAEARDHLSEAEADGTHMADTYKEHLQARAEIGAECTAAALWTLRPLLRVIWHGLCAQGSQQQWARYVMADLSADTLDMRPASLVEEEQGAGNALPWPLLMAADFVGQPLPLDSSALQTRLRNAMHRDVEGGSIRDGGGASSSSRSSKAAKTMGAEAQAVLDAKGVKGGPGSSEKGGGGKAAVMLGMLEVPPHDANDSGSDSVSTSASSRSPGPRAAREKRPSLLQRFSFAVTRSSADGNAPRRRLSVASLLGAGGPLSPPRRTVPSHEEQSRMAERRRVSHTSQGRLASAKAAALLGVRAASGRAARVRAASQAKSANSSSGASAAPIALPEDGPSAAGLLALPLFWSIQEGGDPDPGEQNGGTCAGYAHSGGRRTLRKPPLLPVPIAQALLSLLSQVLPLASPSELGLSSRPRASPVPLFDPARRVLSCTPASMTHVWEVAPLDMDAVAKGAGAKAGPSGPPGGGSAALSAAAGTCAALVRALLLMSPGALQRTLRTVQLWRGEIASLLHCSLHARGVWGASDEAEGEVLLGKAAVACPQQGRVGTVGVRMPLPPGGGGAPAPQTPPPAPTAQGGAGDSDEEEHCDSDDELELPEDANATAKYALGTACVPGSPLFLARSAEATSVPTPMKALLHSLTGHLSSEKGGAPGGGGALQLLNVPLSPGVAADLLRGACGHPLLLAFVLWRWQWAARLPPLAMAEGGGECGQGGLLAALHSSRWSIVCVTQGQSALAGAAQLHRHAIAALWSSGGESEGGLAWKPPSTPLLAGDAARCMVHIDSQMQHLGDAVATASSQNAQALLMDRSAIAPGESRGGAAAADTKQGGWLGALQEPPAGAVGDAVKVFLEHTCTAPAGTPSVRGPVFMPWGVKEPPSTGLGGGATKLGTRPALAATAHGAPPSPPKATPHPTALATHDVTGGSSPKGTPPLWPVACAAPPLDMPHSGHVPPEDMKVALSKGGSELDLSAPQLWAAHVVTIPPPSIPLAPPGADATGMPRGTSAYAPLVSVLRALQAAKVGQVQPSCTHLRLVAVGSVGGCAPAEKVHRVHGQGVKRGGPSSPARPKFSPTASAARLVTYNPPAAVLEGGGSTLFVTRHEVAWPVGAAAASKGPPSLAKGGGAAKGPPTLAKGGGAFSPK